MIRLDDVLAQEYLEESRDNLARVETDLLALEQGGAGVDPELVAGIFRAVHSIKGGAGFFALTRVGELAHRMENALALIRSGEMAPSRERVRILLLAADRLSDLIGQPDGSEAQDISGIVADLDRLRDEVHRAEGLRMLLVEDDFVCRLVLQQSLGRYGECHIAVNGKEAVEAFRAALERGQGYKLICMDIMMPEMDGHEAVERIRALEQQQGIFSSCGVKIVMTTALDDIKEVSRSFMELCDGYLVKPVDLGKLHAYLHSFGLAK